MAFLSSRERDNLLTEYNHLHDAIWRRGEQAWIVQSILITGSLIVAFQSNDMNPIRFSVSLVLVVISFFLWWTTNINDSIDFARMEEIEGTLGMNGRSRVYHCRREGRLWYIFRTNSWYALFIVLSGVYVYFLFMSKDLSIALMSLGFFAIVVKEICLYARRSH
jgi:cytochrome b subunit of formate dehydrogenase